MVLNSSGVMFCRVGFFRGLIVVVLNFCGVELAWGCISAVLNLCGVLLFLC